MSAPRPPAAEAKPHVLSQATQAFLAKQKRLLIGGNWCDSEDGLTLNTLNPANGQTLGVIPDAGAADIDRAVAAARVALETAPWAGMRPAMRERLLLKLADLVDANADELAELECLDNGKSLNLARRVDVRSAVDFLRYVAGWATKIEGSTLELSLPRPRDGGDYLAYTRREPVGVVGAIIPWNFPLLMAVWKIGPALAAGCTVVLKPAEDTPLTALRLGELVLEAGIPAGVVNIVTGRGHIAGATLAGHPGVDKIAFTGSTEVGRLIGKAAMDHMTRVSLELGGKSPVIIFPDANLDEAIAGAGSAIFYNHGQVCCAGSRLYAHKNVLDRVLEGIAASAAKIVLGSGLDPRSQMGPLISARQRDRVSAFIDSGLSEGAKLVTGGERVEGEGFFVRPTVFADVNDRMKVVREEIFGPVLVVAPFDTPEEALTRANNSAYGLAASVWSQNIKTVRRMSAGLKAGTVWVNCHNLLDPAMPFGGYKQSGIGREMGRSVIDLYTETKSVCIQA